MKQSVHELLDGCTPAELDEYLTELPAESLDDIAAKRIAARAAEKVGLKPVRRSFPRRLLPVAALAVILAAALVGCYVVDEAQYNRALQFFDLNHLSVEGLDRGEVKRVYRDVTAESFTYDKTAEVIESNALYTVEGVAFSITNTVNNTWATDHEGDAVAFDNTLLWNTGAAGTATDADGSTAEVKTSEWQSGGDERYLIYLLTDASGHLLARRETRMDDLLSVGRVAPAQDGWLAEVFLRDTGMLYGSKPYILRLSTDGEVLARYRFEDNGVYDHIEDMIELDGRVFISATVRPEKSKLYDDIEDMTDGVDPDRPSGSYTDEWRDRAREEFSAVLLVIDADSGEPGQFYTVGGAFGGALGADEDGNLRWSVGRIVACGWSPATNSFSIYGVTRRYDYAFDSARSLFRQERTDVINGFRMH